MDATSRAGIPRLEVRLLGPIEVERDGEPAGLGGPKPRVLLALLALEPGRVVSVDRLVEALWPGGPPETAAHAVQVYVSQLRKALGPAIATRAPGYELELDPDRVDVGRFSRLGQEGRVALEGGDAAAAEGAFREALALWRGPALADFLYEPFAQTEIARLEELRTVTLEERIEADLALGRHAELVSELEALVAAQPLRERPRAQLMLALYRSGRQADALAAYRTARQTLVEELGIDPGPELRELEAAILRQDESLLLEEAPLARSAMQFRRLVTILFVDVVESMALAEALDPEALGLVLHRYFESVSAALRRHGGTVEKYAGDAVMAAFGIPQAHEDDSERAVRAALEILEGVDDVGSPNRILREEIGGRVIVRTGRRIPGVIPHGGVHAPISVVRMAVGDAYGAKEWREGEGANEAAFRTERIERRICRGVAEFAFQLAERTGAKVFGGPKYTVSPVYEGMLKEEMDSAAERHPEVPYEPQLIDATFALLVATAGDPLVIPSLNRDGDILSDLVLPLFGSIAGAESLLVAFADDDPTQVTAVMAEAAHGTAPALQGKNVANPLAMMPTGSATMIRPMKIVTPAMSLPTAVTGTTSP